MLSLFMLAGCMWSRIKTAEIERLRGETDVLVDATQESMEKLTTCTDSNVQKGEHADKLLERRNALAKSITVDLAKAQEEEKFCLWQIRKISDGIQEKELELRRLELKMESDAQSVGALLLEALSMLLNVDENSLASMKMNDADLKDYIVSELYRRTKIPKETLGTYTVQALLEQVDKAKGIKVPD